MSNIKVDGFKVSFTRILKIAIPRYSMLIVHYDVQSSLPTFSLLLLQCSTGTVMRRGRRRSRRCIHPIQTSLDHPLMVSTHKTNGIFELRVKNAEGKEATWTIDLKNTGSVYLGEAKPKPNVTILLSDETFQDLASGKVQKILSP